MTEALTVATLRMALAFIAGRLSSWFRVSSPVVEIVIGMAAQLVIGADMLGTHYSWIKFLSVMGAILLTFLTGTEIDPAILNLKLAADLNVDLLAIGARGHSALYERMIGSQADHISPPRPKPANLQLLTSKTASILSY